MLLPRVLRLLPLALACAVGLAASAVADPQTSVPAFARIGGVRVGLDTMQRLEGRFGPGKSTLGGHARGARVWRTPAGYRICADGFNSFDRNGISYAGGRQIDGFSVSAAGDDDSALPPAHANKDQLKFMGRVGLGTDRAMALLTLDSVLPPPDRDGNDLVWRAQGFVRVSHVNRYETTEWEARLVFDEKGRLAEIRIRTLN